MSYAICGRNFRPLILIPALLMMLFCAPPARAQLSRIRFHSYKITSVVPSTVNSIRGAVEFVLTNDTTSFTMSDIHGIIYRNGKPFVHGFCNDTHVRQGEVTVRPAGTVQLCDSVSLWDVFRNLSDLQLDEYTGDLEMIITDAKGKSRTYSKKGIPVELLLNNSLKKKSSKELTTND